MTLARPDACDTEEDLLRMQEEVLCLIHAVLLLTFANDKFIN